MPTAASDALLTLTTDFGMGSVYVAQLKAAVLRRLPGARIVDLCHSIAPQAVEAAAWFVEQACPWFPAESLHLVIVDPGVGTSRRIVLLRVAGQWFLGPDNGLFGPLVRYHGCDEAWEVTNATLWTGNPSPTFHGRDIMAPLAAQLLVGLSPDRVGPRVSPATIQLGPDSPFERGEREIRGQVIFLDAYGNAITSIPSGELPAPSANLHLQARPATRKAGRESCTTIFEWVTCYGERPAGTRVALVGSGGRVEFAVVQGSAAALEGLQVGDRVQISW